MQSARFHTTPLAKVGLIDLQDPLDLLSLGPSPKEKGILSAIDGKNIRSGHSRSAEKARKVWRMLNPRAADIDGIHLVTIRHRIDVQIRQTKLNKAANPLGVLVIRHQ